MPWKPSGGKRATTNDDLAPSRHLKHYARLLPALESYLSSKHKQTPWDRSRCVCPLESAHTFAAEAYDILYAKLPYTPEQSMLLAATDADMLAAVLPWSKTQHVYRFDYDFARELVDTPLGEALPMELLLQLPDWCVYVEATGVIPPLTADTAMTPIGGYVPSGSQAIGFYAYITPRASSPAKRVVFVDDEFELVIVEDFGEQLGYLQHVFPLLPNATFNELAATMNTRYPTPFGTPIDEHSSSAHAMLSMLLYLVDDSIDLNGKAPPQHPRTAPRANPKHPTVWQVGYRVGSALRRAWATAPSEPLGGSHASPRAHMRRGHRHLYWTGEGRKTPRVRWVAPVAVGAGKIVPTVRTVG